MSSIHGNGFRHSPDLGEGPRGEPRRAYPHGRAVAEAVVGAGIPAEHPLLEPSSVSAVRVALADLPHVPHRQAAESGVERVVAGIRRAGAPFGLHDRPGDGERHDAVVRGEACVREQIELLAPVVVELES